MVREDLGESVDAYQDAKRPRGSGRADSPSRGFVHAVVTRTQKRRKQDQVLVADQDPDLDSEFDDPTSSPDSSGKRHHHHTSVIEQSLKPWTPSFLAEKQKEDRDLALVHSWLNTSSPPDWNDIRGESPSVKAYLKQFNSLILKEGVIYRRLEPLSN